MDITAIREPEPPSDPVQVLSRLFGVSIPVFPWCSRDGFGFTERWWHGDVRGRIPALANHLVCVVHSGSGTVRLSREDFRTVAHVRRGTFTVVPRGMAFDIDFSGRVECSQFIIPDELFKRCARECGLDDSVTLLERASFADEALAQLALILAGDPADATVDEHYLERCAVLICTYLARKHSSAAAVTGVSEAIGLPAWQLRRIREYMTANMQDALSLADIAGVAGLSRHYLCTAFRHATGFTPHEYLTYIRVERAKGMLMSSRRPVSEISRSVGYGTASAFTATFRRVTGLTPREYRCRASGEIPPPSEQEEPAEAL